MNKGLQSGLIAGLFLTLSNLSISQNVGINTTGVAPNAAAILDLNTGNSGSMGFLAEQVALTATNAAGPVAAPPTGLIVYNTATAGASPHNVVPGYYFNAGTPAAPNWMQFVAGNSATTTTGGWLLNGNTGTNPANNFVGTIDANALNFRTNNTQWMTILSTGLVGIWDAAPVYVLTVTANGAAVPIGYFGNSNNTGVGFWAANTAASGASSGIGIIGNSLQTAGSAIAGEMGNAVSNYYQGSALSGTADASVAGGLGVIGSSGSATGLGAEGVNLNALGTGVLGAGNNVGGTYLAAGSGGAFTGKTCGVYSVSTLNSNASAAQVSIIAQDGTGGQADVNVWNGGTHYKILATYAAPNSCSVPDMNNNMVVMHSPETPEFYFEDYGEGRLVNGKAHVTIDPILAKNVAISAKHPLRVFVQLDSDVTCKGVIVCNKTATGFDVVELNGGTSSTPFEWHLVCNVKDQVVNGTTVNKLQDIRFEPTPPIFESKTTSPTAASVKPANVNPKP